MGAVRVAISRLVAEKDQHQRPFHRMLHSENEFREKVAGGDHFLTTVLKGSVQFVKGEKRDLDAVAGK